MRSLLLFGVLILVPASTGRAQVAPPEYGFRKVLSSVAAPFKKKERSPYGESDEKPIEPENTSPRLKTLLIKVKAPTLSERHELEQAAEPSKSFKDRLQPLLFWRSAEPTGYVAPVAGAENPAHFQTPNSKKSIPIVNKSSPMEPTTPEVIPIAKNGGSESTKAKWFSVKKPRQWFGKETRPNFIGSQPTQEEIAKAVQAKEEKRNWRQLVTFRKEEKDATEEHEGLIQAGLNTAVPNSITDVISSRFAADEDAEPVVTELYVGQAPQFPDATIWYRHRLLEGTYFQVGVIYWRPNAQRDNGIITQSVVEDQTNPGGPPLSQDNFNTGEPNPDHEFGFKLLVGKQINDFWAVELGGHWLHQFNYPAAMANAVSGGGQLGTPNTITRVFLNPDGIPGADPRDPAVAPSAEEILSAAFHYRIKTHGIQLNTRFPVYDHDRFQVDGIVGLRYFDLAEKFRSRITDINSVVVSESFRADNSYFGPQIGTISWFSVCDYVLLEGLAKFGMTANFADIDIHGPPAGSGILTGAGNLGGSHNSEYSSIFEIGLNVVLQLTPNIEVAGGLSAIWLGEAFRAMDQIDLANVPNRNVTLTPTSESLWISGYNMTTTIRY